MKSEITLSNMEFYSFIGCYKEEKIIGTRFLVSVTLTCDLFQAAQTDNLSQTINYQSVYCSIKKVMQQPANLIEAAAYSIIQTLKQEFEAIKTVRVTVAKLNPMLSAGGKIDAVTVTLEA
ncbi:MAG: dihydroneopterin aldolase [Bacteroidales bacterium]|jgi:7,8-dihydroneopterin aldolase/epimerase/oxygenase|nr:dihydroneopterin aldolase [Bacteroidales bacterium]MDD4395153.1 dihydroneopterin aldolase [Bacteroidales bacterium]